MKSKTAQHLKLADAAQRQSDRQVSRHSLPHSHSEKKEPPPPNHRLLETQNRQCVKDALIGGQHCKRQAKVAMN